MPENSEVKSNRRQVIAGVTGIAAMASLALAKPVGARTNADAKFPKGFRWGAATAGHQVEGNNVNADFWLLENIVPTCFAERSGDACDSYHRYEDDIVLLAKLGLNTYRFSIEWSRIEPSRGQFSVAELDYYRRVIECCRRHGITPAVTFMHNTAPIWFAANGGWLNKESSDLFASYCSVAAKALASDMDFAFTMNEPQVARGFRVFSGASSYFVKHDQLELAAHAAAAKACGSDRFVSMVHPDIEGMTPNLIAGHEKAVSAIKAERSLLPVGVTLNIIDYQPGAVDSPYTEIRKKAYGDWLDAVKRAGDFTGAQIYRQFSVPGHGESLPRPEPLPFAEPANMMSQTARPEALYNGIEYIYEQTGKPIFVSENGFSTENDEHRAMYIRAAIAEMKRAIDKGIPVLGYAHWSLIDNFEWESGFKVKYGLATVDRKTFVRTPKPSAYVYGKIAKENRL